MGVPLEITLSWPDKALWPNGGFGNRFAHHRASKAAKDEAFWVTKIVKPLDWRHDDTQPLAIHILAHPKTANRVDAQNLIAGLKYQFDGIAAALGVDDKCFLAPTVEWAEPVKGGSVTIVVTA
jgi:hypothetical protein